jgi:DNA repair exonuclease SbcCD ATPase subunit
MVRTRAAESQSLAVPLPPAKGTCRKRRASSIASVNEDVDSTATSQAANNNGTVSRKRRIRRSDSEQLDQELGDAATESTVLETTTQEQGAMDNVEVMIDSYSNSTKHVHFSDPIQPIAGIQSSPPMRTQEGTLSPSIRQVPTKSRKTRHSMPARLPGTPDRLIDQINFAPLKQTLSARNQRRLKRNHLSEEMNDIEEHEKDYARKDRELKRLHEEIEAKDKMLAELNWEVEDRRQRGIEIDEGDDEQAERIQAMEQELAKMREELAAQHAASEEGDTDVDDDLVFIDPSDINVSHEDMTPITSFERVRPHPVQASPSPVADTLREVEIQKFEKAIFKLSQEAADAKAALQNLDIELQSLGFAGQDDPGLVICSAIRQAFEQARYEAEELLPDQAPNTMEGAEFLKLLIDNIRGLLQQIDQDVNKINKLEEMEALLKGQHNGLLDQLSQTELRKSTLEKNYKTLDRELDSKSKRIVQIDEHCTSLASTVQSQAEELSQDQDMITELNSQHSDNIVAINRLKETLEKYRTDLANMKVLIENMNKEHTAKVAQIEQDATQAIEELKEELTNELRNRHTAENDIDEKTTQVTQLQIDIESAETKIDHLKQQLANAKEDAAAESQQREDTENELAQKSEFIDELEGKIAHLESDLEDYRQDANKLNELVDAERRQLEATEAELDLREEKITDLESRLHDEEVRGNELRMKLYEEQRAREEIVAELNSTAADREVQYQSDMDLEISHRMELEQVIAARDSKIEVLEEKIKELDDAMVELIKAKDELQQESQDEIERLEASLTESNNEYKYLVKNKAAEIQGLHNNIASLTEGQHTRDNLISTLETENQEISSARQTENDDKDGQIADLGDDLNMARKQIANLEAEKGRLELRVEHEASELLDYQNETSQAIQNLRDQLAERNDEIKQLKKDTSDMQYQHHVETTAKVDEITRLHGVNTTSTANIEKLKSQVALLQQKLRQRVHAEQKSIPTMINVLRNALAQAEATGEDLIDGGVKDLEEVEDMEEVESTEAKTLTPVSMTNGFTRTVKVTKQRRVLRSRKIRDSGFGAASDSEEIEAEVEESVYA